MLGMMMLELFYEMKITETNRAAERVSLEMDYKECRQTNKKRPAGHRHQGGLGSIQYYSLQRSQQSRSSGFSQIYIYFLMETATRVMMDCFFRQENVGIRSKCLCRLAWRLYTFVSFSSFIQQQIEKRFTDSHERIWSSLIDRLVSHMLMPV